MEYRTHQCGKITEQYIGEKVTITGWVQKRRDLGGLIFIDLRDRSGVVQIVFSPEVSSEALETAEKVRSEYVLTITGKVLERDPSTVNPAMNTGKIEISGEEVKILNSAKTPPFSISEDMDITEDIRLKYRYLDLRRPIMQETLKMRHEVTRYIRNFLENDEFMEMETPMLTKSTPEGARDYLVPSRVHPGEFYALPQSPQLFKQLLMVSGFEKYYQIVRCFRDEDLRADRQPEFTQVDIETSFMGQEPLLAMMEEMMTGLVKKVKGVEIPKPFPRMTYKEAMDRYGSDKPDTRFGLELINVSEIVKDSGFKVFAAAVENGGQVKAINVKGKAANYSRKDIDGLTEFTARYGAKGLAWMKVEAEGLKGPISKFFNEEDAANLTNALQAEEGDLLLFVADKPSVVADSLGALRQKLAKDLDLIDQSKHNFLWVVDFPLVEYDEDADRFVALHHPFTMPKIEDLHLMDSNPAEVRAQAYDLVLNGYELGGGSQRIYQRDVQEKMFKTLGFTEEAAREEFGFLLEAFEYGTPPHGGIALGLDRIVMLLAGRSNLRDTIAFPKTASASCLLTNAPSAVNEKQLDELHLSVKVKQETK
ncbi:MULTISPECIES: aspartate--tRNA ligase [Fictibacillus]|jgi:aspartyl-tRNA synthetase|uniref:aspartate--tRNA ligase n=1 Tax=Fictibacillus TaxID=1329200 RepID=UPI0018CEEFAE|nr:MULTISPECIES: aspartate--tRNA ligase [unclassified Fictibacillus]MBH0159969.1 aspartate--tRNA ligase [Fictibacillus sp. 26RED30]MBH0163279.1 aspartate--tRNA ligase [Fictibacillus sp. 7GRE50]MBH0175073.1 aspartate--tRNA ligase [Fictibacillus sp. 23RED33]